jgi:hypothetical protein
MECTKCRFCCFEVGRRHIEDEATPLHQFDGTAIRIGFVAVAQRPPQRQASR